MQFGAFGQGQGKRANPCKQIDDLSGRADSPNDGLQKGGLTFCGGLQERSGGR